MLSPDLFTIIALTAAVCAVVATFWLAIRLYKLVEYCRAAVSFVQNENKRAVSLRRIAEIESSLTDLTDSYDAMLRSMKKLRARITMRDVRRGEKTAGTEVESTEAAPPGDELGRAAYKKALRDKAKADNLL